MDHSHQFPPIVSDTVRRSFYVDDCLCSVPTQTEAIQLRENLTNLLPLGGFKITKWLSNSRQVLNSIPRDDLAPAVQNKNLKLTDVPVNYALGIIWDTKHDTIEFKWKDKSAPLTKSGILSTISSLYDPLDIVAPFAIRGKLIMQGLSKAGLGLDETVPSQYVDEWSTWLQELSTLINIGLPRCIKPPEFSSVKDTQLHHFCDASEDAYAVVSYIRMRDEIGNICCSFLLGKSRLSPLKTVSIPRLELAAASLAVKQNGLLQQKLDMTLNTTHYWTDFKTVLKYIHNRTNRFQTYVANRIANIHRGSELSQWNYIPSKQNPADEASRGMRANEFLPSCRWLKGPSF